MGITVQQGRQTCKEIIHSISQRGGGRGTERDGGSGHFRCRDPEDTVGTGKVRAAS